MTTLPIHREKLTEALGALGSASFALQGSQTERDAQAQSDIGAAAVLVLAVLKDLEAMG